METTKYIPKKISRLVIFLFRQTISRNIWWKKSLYITENFSWHQLIKISQYWIEYYPNLLLSNFTIILLQIFLYITVLDWELLRLIFSFTIQLHDFFYTSYYTKIKLELYKTSMYWIENYPDYIFVFLFLAHIIQSAWTD